MHKGGVVVKEEDEEEAKARKAREGKAKSGAGGEAPIRNSQSHSGRGRTVS